MRGVTLWRVIAAATLPLVVAISALTSAPAAEAGSVITAGDVQCQRIDEYSGRCLIDVLAPHSPGAGTTSGHGATSVDRGRACYSGWSFRDVPCASDLGTWSNSRSCYVKATSDLPGSLLFEGRDDGAVYTCTPDIGNQFQTAYPFWSATPPDGPDPAQLAQEAITAMGLTAVTIGIVPRDDPGSVGLVGLPVWMWVEQPSSNTYGPITGSAAAGGVTVTATGHVESVSWAMGDGDTVICRGTGTAYSDAAGASPSPDCGHTYTRTSVRQPAHAYTVTATSHWVVDWAGGGAAGQEALDLTATTAVRIGETQAIITS